MAHVGLVVVTACAPAEPGLSTSDGQHRAEPATQRQALGTYRGLVEIFTADGGQLLLVGDSATVFTLRLPPDAGCSGDSSMRYSWGTYLVSGNRDPATLTLHRQDGPIVPTWGAPLDAFQ
jgi:hypothetical protein